MSRNLLLSFINFALPMSVRFPQRVMSIIEWLSFAQNTSICRPCVHFLLHWLIIFCVQNGWLNLRKSYSTHRSALEIRLRFRNGPCFNNGFQFRLQIDALFLDHTFVYLNFNYGVRVDLDATLLLWKYLLIQSVHLTIEFEKLLWLALQWLDQLR